MKRLPLFLLLLSFGGVCAAQGRSDRELMLRAEFPEMKESLPDSLNAFERGLAAVSRQLVGRCHFDPPCYLFFTRACEQYGVLPAVIFTSDRLLRDSRIGMSGQHFTQERSHIREDVEAYISRKRP